ncbi:hypothetical protein FCM35_KLT02670 [Carex littledalei]|uniref:PGG domain-containing protein n=1 Tax=Carex littledalei TaxID=544730 RepID=A0A833R8T6_9POAL|nr:hypothetical protein FCM35_KLT02670 [Carex littledalei]
MHDSYDSKIIATCILVVPFCLYSSLMIMKLIIIIAECLRRTTPFSSHHVHEISLSAVSPKNYNGSIEQQPQPPLQQYNPNTILQPTPPSPTTQAHNNNALLQDARQKWFEDMRGWIMVVAVLVASVTYTTGLSPPGGLWQDELDGHKAGSSILHDKFPNRYTTFFYANATAFMTSLVIIILLMNEKFYCDRYRVIMLNMSMVLDLVSLMIAYAAGCARRLSTSIYVIVLAVGVLLVVFYSAYLYSLASKLKRASWVVDVVGRDFIPDHASSSVQPKDCGIARSLKKHEALPNSSKVPSTIYLEW